MKNAPLFFPELWTLCRCWPSGRYKFAPRERASARSARAIHQISLTSLPIFQLPAAPYVIAMAAWCLNEKPPHAKCLS